VSVAGGRVRGAQRGSLWAFSGIPYAQAPVGPLRWRPPQPPEAWDGVHDATVFGPIAPQSAPVSGITSPADLDTSEPQSEDCLTLNIWTPEVPEMPAFPAPGKGRPVMVWVHGGGFTGGSGSTVLYRGGEMARNGDVVVVTINYRLGALGFLGHRALHDPDGYIGNWGLHDQVAALRWVRDHIARFGGDAGNVTVFGESAGGFSVAALLGTPGAAGLFRRAIIQSGGVHVHTVEEAERAGDRLASLLGLASCDRSLLEAVPAADLVGATAELGKRRPDPGLIRLPFLPVVDGAFLPQHPLAAVEQGSSARVDLIIGTNKDEVTVFGLGDPALQTLDDAEVASWTELAAPDMPSLELIDTYRRARVARSEEVTPRDLWFATGTDGVFRWPSLQLAAAQHAQGARTFVYLFEWESPAFGGILGSCHALEVPFVFGSVRIPAVQLFTGGGPDAEMLSFLIQRAWTSFARTGDPSHPALGNWTTWDPSRRSTMVFGAQSRMEDGPRNAELSVWDQHRPLFVPVGPRSGAGHVQG
jgi:para-nitrobenzyl esterase